MKFIEIISESEEERLLKKAHTIYKALKTGVLNRGQWGVVKYRLPDHYKVDLDHSNDIFIKVGGKGEDNRVIFYYEDDITGELKELKLPGLKEYKIFIERINYKFQPFDITIWHDQSVELNESTVENRLYKRAVTINKGLRKGTITLDTDRDGREIISKYRYELPERCYVSIHDGDILRIHYRYELGTKNIGDKLPLKIWKITDNGEVLLNDKLINHDYDYIEDDMENTELSHIFVNVINHLKNRYRHFNIKLDLNPYSKMLN